MSRDDLDDPASSFETAAVRPGEVDAGPLGLLPRVSLREARLASKLARVEAGGWPAFALGWLADAIGGLDVGRPEVVWRASGLRRVGLVVQLGWPRLSTRLAVGLDTNLAHAVVDRLLGFDRLPAEGRLSVTPVEWGILTYAVAETLRRITLGPPGPLGSSDLTVDRVGPDPFDGTGLGRVITLRWPLQIGDVEGSLRLWTPELLVTRWLLADPTAPGLTPETSARFRETSAVWRAEAGAISLPRGLKTLRPGGVLPLLDSRLRGTPQSPNGPVSLTNDLAGTSGRYTILTEPVPLSGGGRLTVTGAPYHASKPREAITVPPPPVSPSPEPSPVGPTDVPVTLVVELGRLNLPLSRLADLHPGDVVELGRHSREPVELTSGGRLVARGELVLIDTELGVRVTQVYL